MLSGVNLVEGGPLTVFREMARAAVAHRPRWTVYALVHKVGLLGVPGVIELPFEQIKGSWLRRMRFEWFDVRRLCRRLAPDVWISAHDISPRIDGPRQFVYCHNPAPFSTVPARQAWKDPTFALFEVFYGLLYGINIKRNKAVIVQQQWLRDEFRKRYGVAEVIVAHPSGIPHQGPRGRRSGQPPRRFLYPTLPRVFKNIELIGQALERLEADSAWQGEVVITFDGSEHAYARELAQRFAGLRSLRLVGRQSPEGMNRCYSECDALLFPSLLETWGLPLSEAKDRGIPIVAADLPYAHETVGDYDAVRFFDPRDASGLADLLSALAAGRTSFDPVRRERPQAPYAEGWPALLEMLLDEQVASSPQVSKSAGAPPPGRAA